MRRASRWLTAGVLGVGMIALVVQAQPGGFGGFGGGGGPLALVYNKAVHEELKLSEDQVAKLTEWAKSEGPRIADIRKEKFAGVDFKSEEGRAKFAAINAELTKDTYASLEKSGVLKPEQVKRLKQLDIQNQGVRAFTNPEVVAALKLTDAQKTKISEIAAEYNKESGAIREEYGLGGFGGGFGKNKDKKGGGAKFDPEKFKEGNKKLDTLQSAAVGKIVETLTAEQKTAWKDLTGEPFDVSKLRGGGFGGGFGKGKGKGKDE